MMMLDYVICGDVHDTFICIYICKVRFKFGINKEKMFMNKDVLCHKRFADMST